MTMAAKTAKPPILLVGESPLVEEYASLCHNKGFAVSVRPNPEFARVAIPAGIRRVSKPARTFKLAVELTNIDHETKTRNLVELDKALGPTATIISSSVTVSVSEQSAWITKPGRLVGIGAFPSLLQNGLVEFSASGLTEHSSRKVAEEFCGSIGKEFAFVADSIGMVLPRILSMLANEAFFALSEKVATGTDIDTAMKLGTNYPLGPVDWAERIGIRQVHAVVQALYRSFNEDRYRPSPLLTLEARANRLPNS